MNKLIIGAPFGTHLSWPGVTSTLGTYTLHRRAGFWGRLWRVLRTVRYSFRTQSWVNMLGLPNPGIRSLLMGLLKDLSQNILSVHGFNLQEWAYLAKIAVLLKPLALELNLSCPNVEAVPDLLDGARSAFLLANSAGLRVIAKLPPIRWMSLAEPLYQVGVRTFHCCNTIPTPGGGMSGKPLKQYSLWAVEDLRQRWGKSVTLIGGGGVTDLQDVKDYLSAGADHISIASMLFNPLNWRKVGQFLDYLISSARTERQ